MSFDTRYNIDSPGHFHPLNVEVSSDLLLQPGPVVSAQQRQPAAPHSLHAELLYEAPMANDHDHAFQLPVCIDDAAAEDGDSFIEIQLERRMWLATEVEVVKTSEEHSVATCSVCLDEMEAESTVRMQCGHCIHVKCAQVSERYAILDKHVFQCPECRGIVSFVRAIFHGNGQKLFCLHVSSLLHFRESGLDDEAVVMSDIPGSIEDHVRQEEQEPPIMPVRLNLALQTAGMSVAGGLTPLFKASTILTGAVKVMLDVSVELFHLSPRDCIVKDGVEHTQAEQASVLGTGGDTSLGAPYVSRHKVLMADYERELYSVTHDHQQHCEQLRREVRQQETRSIIRYRAGLILILGVKIALLVYFLLASPAASLGTGTGTPKRPSSKPP